MSEVAEVLAAHEKIHWRTVAGRGTSSVSCRCNQWDLRTPHAEHVAAVLAEYVAAKQAEAWNEGFDRAREVSGNYVLAEEVRRCVNPYKKEE